MSNKQCSYVITEGAFLPVIASICDSLPQLKAIVVYWPDEDMPVMEKSKGVFFVLLH